MLIGRGDADCRPARFLMYRKSGDIHMKTAEPHSELSNPPALLTLALVRRYYFPIGERTLFRLISSGRFPMADIRMGGKLRLWKRETVEAWIQSNSVGV